MPVLGWLFESTPGPPSVWYLALVVVFVLIFGGSLLAYFFRRRLFPGHSLNISLVGRFAIVGAILGAVGLLFLAARYLGVPLLVMRIWLVLEVLAVVAFAAYLAYFYRARYPALLGAYRAEEARRRYVKPARPGGARRRPKKGRR